MGDASALLLFVANFRREPYSTIPSATGGRGRSRMSVVRSSLRRSINGSVRVGGDGVPVDPEPQEASMKGHPLASV